MNDQYYKLTGPEGEAIHGGRFVYDLPTQAAAGQRERGEAGR